MQPATWLSPNKLTSLLGSLLAGWTLLVLDRDYDFPELWLRFGSFLESKPTLFISFHFISFHFIELLSCRGVANLTNSYCPNIIFEVGILCFCLYGVTDIHMWQKGLGIFWWTVGGRIEGVKSAIGTQALNFKSFKLGPFCDLNDLSRLTSHKGNCPLWPGVEEAPIYRVPPLCKACTNCIGEQVHCILYSGFLLVLLSLFLCSSPPSDSILLTMSIKTVC